MTDSANPELWPELSESGQFAARHIGPDQADCDRMLDVVGAETMDELIGEVIPSALRT